MKLRVLLFARYRELAGEAEIAIEVPDGATLDAVWNEVRRRVPALQAERTPLMAVDRAYAGTTTVPHPGAEVAFFPAVSGG